jgi:threonine dehydrogenase-like Zn-dependent dehydrogenase
MDAVTTTARAFWTTGAGRGEIRDERLPAPSADMVVVRAEWSGVSRGTESLVFTGRVPPSEYQRMRAPFQTGHFPWPVKYGYASVGIVESGPDRLIGRRVFALHPHQTRYAVPVSAVHVVHDDVPPRRAVLAANLESAINGLWDAGPRVGDRVTVVGAGTVGCLVAWLAGQIPGCSVELVDINPRRAAVASALKVRFSSPETATQNSDVAFHTSGVPAGLLIALRTAGFEATIVDMSWYGDAQVALPLGEAFHAQRLTLKSSQVGSVAPVRRARWSSARRLELALALLADGALDVLMTGESAFEELPDVMARLSTAPGDTLCHCIRY